MLVGTFNFGLFHSSKLNVPTLSFFIPSYVAANLLRHAKWAIFSNEAPSKEVPPAKNQPDE